MKIYFDLDLDDEENENYNEKLLEENVPKLIELIKYFFKEGIIPVTGDALDITGKKKDDDGYTYQIKERSFSISEYGESLSFKVSLIS